MDKEAFQVYRDLLVERQQREGWSDREMGRQLGVGPTTWLKIRRGQRRIGGTVLLHMMARFPEYNDTARSFLPGFAPIVSKSAPNESDDDRAA